MQILVRGYLLVVKKIVDVKIAPDSIRTGDEGGAITNKNSNNRAYYLGTNFIADISKGVSFGCRKKLSMSKSFRNPSV